QQVLVLTHDDTSRRVIHPTGGSETTFVTTGSRPTTTRARLYGPPAVAICTGSLDTGSQPEGHCIELRTQLSEKDVASFTTYYNARYVPATKKVTTIHAAPAHASQRLGPPSILHIGAERGRELLSLPYKLLRISCVDSFCRVLFTNVCST